MEKPFKLELRITLAKGYDEIEKQEIAITVDDFAKAYQVWTAVTGVFQQYSRMQSPNQTQ